jgi:hypothetical protein
MDWITETNSKIILPEGVVQKLFELGAAMGRPDILEKAVKVLPSPPLLLTFVDSEFSRPNFDSIRACPYDRRVLSLWKS